MGEIKSARKSDIVKALTLSLQTSSKKNTSFSSLRDSDGYGRLIMIEISRRNSAKRSLNLACDFISSLRISSRQSSFPLSEVSSSMSEPALLYLGVTKSRGNPDFPTLLRSNASILISRVISTRAFFTIRIGSRHTSMNCFKIIRLQCQSM